MSTLDSACGTMHVPTVPSNPLRSRFLVLKYMHPFFWNKNTCISHPALPHLYRVSHVRHTANMSRLPCARLLPWAESGGTRQTEPLPCAYIFFAVSRVSRHTANSPMVCPRQIFWHTTNARFPVVVLRLNPPFSKTVKAGTSASKLHVQYGK